MSIESRLSPSLPQFDALTALDRQAGLREGQLEGLGGAAPAAEGGVSSDLVDHGERLLNARAWDDEGARALATGDFPPGGGEPAEDLALVDALVEGL